jgi:hypothetical protein
VAGWLVYAGGGGSCPRHPLLNGVEQLAVTGPSLVIAVLYYLGNGPDVFPFLPLLLALVPLRGLFL